MNKFLKIFYAIFGAMNLMFQVYIPITVATISAIYFELSQFAKISVLIVGIGASIYQATKLFKE